MTVPFLAQQPVDDFGHRISDIKFSCSLLPSNEESVVIPGAAQKYKALIKYSSVGANVWVAINNTAALPAGNTFVATLSELVNINGICREVRNGDTLSFIFEDPTSTITECAVSISLYAMGTTAGI